MHRLQSRAFGWYARSLALVCVGAIITQNYLASGLPILFVDPELAYEYHTATVPVIQIFGRAGFGVCALLHVAYYQRRHLIDLLLLVVVFLSPLTRLARIDLLLSGMTLIVLNFHFPLVRLTRRTILGAAVVLAAFVYGLVELGNQRVNRFGAYSVSYAEAIGFRAPPGPGEVLAVTYGYFALSFENLDRFVRGNQRYRTWGLLSFSPLFNAFFIVDRLTGGAYPGPEVIVARRNPVGRMATVETALSAFYLDFGTGIAWLPMLLSMSLWLALYRRRERATGYAVAYSMYSAAMMLSAFQPVAAAPFLYQAIALAGLPFVLPKLRWPRQPSLAPAARS